MNLGGILSHTSTKPKPVTYCFLFWSLYSQYSWCLSGRS